MRTAQRSDRQKEALSTATLGSTSVGTLRPERTCFICDCASHLHTLRGSGCPYPQPGCETQRRSERCVTLAGMSRESKAFNFHTFFIEPCIVSLDFYPVPLFTELQRATKITTLS